MKMSITKVSLAMKAIITKHQKRIAPLRGDVLFRHFGL